MHFYIVTIRSKDISINGHGEAYKRLQKRIVRAENMVEAVSRVSKSILGELISVRKAPYKTVSAINRSMRILDSVML